MTLSSFHQSLGRASLGRLEQVINWIERPSQPGQNEALRAAWHAAKRDSRMRERLISAIERDIIDMRPTEARYVGKRLDCSAGDPSVGDVMRAIAERLEPPHKADPLSVGPLFAVASCFFAKVLLEAAGQEERSRGRRRRGR